MSTGQLIILGLVAAIVGVPVYGFVCWMWPYGPCVRCSGSGRKSSPSGKYFRDCRRCRGSGRRIRTGRRVWTFLAGQRRAAR